MTSKRILALVSLILVMCLSVFAFTACENNDKEDTKPGETVNPGDDNKDPVGDELKVSFMVQNENGEWEVLKNVDVVDGAVVAPDAPAKKYYSFSGWFKDADAKDKFVETGIKASTKAYASYAPDEVNVTINGKAVGTQNLVDVVNNNYKPGEGLEFDGWYKDATCSVLWDGKEVVKDLYAKTVAKITITNGYEELYSTKVNPGETFANPAETTVTVDGIDTTLELSFIKSYMSKYDIDYVDENGELIDFTKPVEKSMNITVLWNSVGLSGFAPLPKNSDDHYYLRVQSLPEILKDAPVLSLRNKYTVEKVDGETVALDTYTVDFVKFAFDCMPDTAKKLIFGDGIKAIQGVNGSAASSVEEIVLPKTLKILDNSFNNMPKLKGVTLPEGLEVLIGSFFIECGASSTTHSLGMVNPNYEIAVPDSVINIAMMPNNLKFTHTKATAENGDFYKGEDGRIYLVDARGLILVADPNAVTGKFVSGSLIIPKAGLIIVPDEVVGIQVGTYETCFDYLILSKNFKFVNYNANIENYAEFYDIYNTKISEGGNVLFDANQYKQYFTKENALQPDFSNDSNIAWEGIEITGRIGGFYHPLMGMHEGVGVLVMNMAKADCTTEINFAFTQAPALWGGYVTLPNLDKLVNFADKVNTVWVSAPFKNGEVQSNSFAKMEGVTTISYEKIMETLIANNPEAKNILMASRIELYNNGVKVEDNSPVTEDMFLTAEVIAVPVLNIHSNWQVGYTGNGPFFFGDYSNPAAATKFLTGDSTTILKDLKGLSVESIKAIVMNGALEGVKKQFSSSPFPAPADDILKANLDYYFKNGTVEFKVDGKVVDPTTITLENGSVTLEVVWTFA